MSTQKKKPQGMSVSFPFLSFPTVPWEVNRKTKRR
jgi:hypothetical protein